MPWTSTSKVRNILAIGLVFSISVGVDATADETWLVRGKLQGKSGKKAENVSGIACATARGFPRGCLVIDDNMQEAQFVTVKDGEVVVGDMIPLIDNSFEGKRLELDGEGVAYADGYFYVIGSHGHPRDSSHRLDPNKDAARITAHIAASSQIVRFRSDGARATGPVERTAKLREVIAQQPDLNSHRDQRLEKNGLTIEGIWACSRRISRALSERRSRGHTVGRGRRRLWQRGSRCSSLSSTPRSRNRHPRSRSVWRWCSCASRTDRERSRPIRDLLVGRRERRCKAYQGPCRRCWKERETKSGSLAASRRKRIQLARSSPLRSRKGRRTHRNNCPTAMTRRRNQLPHGKTKFRLCDQHANGIPTKKIPRKHSLVAWAAPWGLTNASRTRHCLSGIKPIRIDTYRLTTPPSSFPCSKIP
jgi:hypothetical protein